MDSKEAHQRRLLLFFIGIFLLLTLAEVDSCQKLRLLSYPTKYLRCFAGNQHYFHFNAPALLKHRYNVRKIDEYFARELVFEKIEKRWNYWKKLTGGQPIIKEELGKTPKTVTFLPTNSIALKEILHDLQFFPLLFRDHNDPITFNIPVDGETMKLRLQNNEETGQFLAHNVFNDPPGTADQTTDLFDEINPLEEFNNIEDSSDHVHIFKNVLKVVIPEIYSASLGRTGEFNEQLRIEEDVQRAKNERDGKAVLTPISENSRNAAFRKGFEFMAAGNFGGHVPKKAWLRPIHDALQTERKIITDKLNGEIEADETTKIKYELTAKMLKTGQDAKRRWDELKHDGIIVPKYDANGKLTQVKIKETDVMILSESFELLQSFLQIYPEVENGQRIKINIPIGNTKGGVYLSRAIRGEEQLVVGTRNEDWPESTPRKENGGMFRPSYDDMVDKVLGKVTEPAIFSDVLLGACVSGLDNQPDFDAQFESISASSNGMVKTADLTRSSVELLTISMVAEAASPPDILKAQFVEDIIEVIDKEKRFPTANEMPSLEDPYGNMLNAGKTPVKAGKRTTVKAGRNPVNAEITMNLLKEISRTNVGFDVVFVNSKYPARGVVKKDGEPPKEGTKDARIYVQRNGDSEIPSHALRELTHSVYYGQTVAEIARLSCVNPKKLRVVMLCFASC
ncbi:Hypothetical predicted protein [Paramuricea clavata]|uniref:Uncharacterized protein n=1 Tax=Paramuricea clavata TaxID=317549 RepID=A0A7D9DR62_PARCT|nr:Hypothetical predicted protein [Paramuricea clavata]